MYDYYFILSNSLHIEMDQCRDEGREVAPYESLVAALQKLPEGFAREEIAMSVYRALMALPMAPQVADEPSDFEGITAQLSEPVEKVPHGLTEEQMLDKVLGAWQGRCAGCLLGKPFEGAYAEDIANYYGIEKGAYAPLHYYRARDPEPVPFLTNKADLSIDRVCGMPIDDDTNYTVLSLMLLDKYGKNFKQLEWADNFVRNLPPESTFTAERIAYRNLLDQIFPPKTAVDRNPYREWIGAQIRADMYGYISPGDPLGAAYMAWKDASVTHVKSGIYGAMWVAASLALAYVMPAADAVRRALGVIPVKTRFYRAMHQALCDFDGGMTFEEATAKVRAVYDEKSQHHWCHTISNALIVLNAILYGQNDLEKTLSMAVLPGFDTDCNGATAGSVLGLALGAKALDEKWTAPLHDHLDASLTGTDGFSIAELAQRTVKHIPEEIVY